MARYYFLFKIIGLNSNNYNDETSDWNCLLYVVPLQIIPRKYPLVLSVYSSSLTLNVYYRCCRPVQVFLCIFFYNKKATASLQL